MRFSLSRLPPLWTRLGFALLWLLVISAAHFKLNMEQGETRVIRMGYMPVITNLAAPLLDAASQGRKDVQFKAVKFPSFAEMGQALRNGQIDAGFMIAPLPIVLKQQGEDVKVVMIGNRHESTLVVSKKLGAKRIEDLAGKTVAVPMRYSGHNLGIHRLMEEKGLTGRINVVEMNPPDMAAGMAAGTLDAYFVGEPFAAKSVQAGIADPLIYVESFWPGFMCNVVAVRGSLVQNEPELVERMVTAAARAVTWAGAHHAEAARVLEPYWGHKPELITYVMDTPPNRVRFDLYVPKQAEYQEMVDLMKHFGLAERTDIEGLVDDRFAKKADVSDVTDIESIFED